VGGTAPPFTAVALWTFSRILRFAYEVILLDMYPDGLVAIGALSDTSPLTRTWRALNRLSYRAAARVIVIGRDMTELLQQRYRLDPSRVTYIPHWASVEVDEMEMNGRHPPPSEPDLPDRFIVQYSGNMGLWHDMDSLVRAADLVRDNPYIHFLFIGKGRRRASAERLGRELDVDNITWLEFLPRDQLPASLIRCDAALISLRAGMEGVAVPSKLYGILAAGRPVIAQVPRHSEVAYAVQEESCGIVVEPGDTEGLADAVRRLASTPLLARDMGERARHAYETRYTIDQAVRAYRTIWEA